MSQVVSKVRAAKLELYRKQGKIHAKAVDGRFNRLRWLMVWLTQGIFYGMCWLPWEVSGQLRQAVLFDIAHEKLYLFGLVLWPQDALLLALVLLIAATGLFLVTALAGRLFCGFACPQTVYTSIFVWIEGKIEGDHLARLQLDQGPLTVKKVVLKGSKHLIWLLIAGWTAITFVGYFTPIRELLPSLPGWNVGPWEGFWLIFYAAFTYVQAGLAREAVCQHMCPYSRFQGVMFDPATRSVSYDQPRGEPRRAAGDAKAGDCIDCGICVQVCPTGIDIRDGLQYECINCGLCIDACDQVMTRIGSPTGLIRFAPEASSAGARQGRWYQRPRVALYALLLLGFCALGLWTLSQRSLLRVDILRDRNVLSRETADGRIENAYQLQIMNLTEMPQQYQVSLDAGSPFNIVGERTIQVGAGSIVPFQLTLSAGAEALPAGTHSVAFLIASGEMHTRESSTFRMP
ncbi:cytochrome c oxidase accessory protein CcoG [Ferribacterium limneticum]|uniref:cytochrome c oxidase accessory protein CcoG n=1 Tax=Ferribacterium limneticum TaxID=76259 RepID=UPI001CF81852|nr:cytochrome c oxidase accessory protein CcoG [Ferribacterium limneticum]UCV21173.1 cytochrome c oxidase accessory protein CcoG [Ferribacterium limneticum]